MKIGYIRVSSMEQNENRQIKKMKDLEIEDRFIFIDKQSGSDFERPNYKSMKNIIREGDLGVPASKRGNYTLRIKT